MPPDDGLPCSACPVRDVGNRYPVNDARDPWRRMPRLFDRMRETFGRPMFNVNSRTRRETDHRVSVYCRRVRSIHGDDCSRERMRLCCTTLHATAERTAASKNAYSFWTYAMTMLLADDDLHRELRATRDHAHRVDPSAVFKVLDHCD
jgi:hypothetical protein